MNKEYILDSIFTLDDYISLKIQGYKENEIAAKLYVSRQTLRRWKQRNGINRQTVDQKKYELMVDMINNGVKLGVIAKKMKLTDKQCLRIRKEFMVSY